MEGKKHAACDECRMRNFLALQLSFREVAGLMKISQTSGARKLKCSGESTSCTRCARDEVACNYSVQKPIGRPRKRRRAEDDDGSSEQQEDEVQFISNNGSNISAQWNHEWDHLCNDGLKLFTDEFVWLSK
jgi:hypothetical protein